jgi:GTPase SAR1 family protein
LLCFSVDSLTSFHNISTKWLPEIHHYCPGVPYLLVGLKSDTRDQAADRPSVEYVTLSQANELVKQIEACGYLECSALTQTGLKHVFDESARCVLAAMKAPTKPEKNPKQCLLS